MSKLFIMKLITYYSLFYGVDHKLALSVAKIESNYNQKAVGAVGEIGVYQIRPTKQHPKHKLTDVHNNIRTGLEMINEVRSSCKHKKDLTYMVCYNAGLSGGNKIKHPNKFPYIVKLNKEYNKL